MDNPNRKHQSSQPGKAGFFLRILMKARGKKLDNTTSHQTSDSIEQESSLEGHGINFSRLKEKKEILSEKEISGITKKWRALGKFGCTNDEEMKIMLLHTYKEQARNLERNISIIEWGKFKKSAIEALSQIGFDGNKIGIDLEKWRIIDLIDLNEQDRIDLEIHKYRQKSLEEGEKEKKSAQS
jgi:hypothetical protein